jgi:hypothetical protein
MSNTFMKDLVTLLAAETVAKPVMQFAGDAAGAFLVKDHLVLQVQM